MCVCVCVCGGGHANKFMSTYWEMGILDPFQRYKIECFGKKIIWFIFFENKNKMQDPALHLILEDFYKFKNCVKNNLKMNYVEFRIHVQTDHLCFYKNFTKQTFTFSSSKVVYFKKHLALQKKVSTSIPLQPDNLSL